MYVCTFFFYVICVCFRHWNQIKHNVQHFFDQDSVEFTLEQIVALGLLQYAEQICEISGAASKELSIEQVKDLQHCFTASLLPAYTFPQLFHTPTLAVSSVSPLLRYVHFIHTFFFHPSNTLFTHITL